MLNSIFQDIQYALRALRASPGFAAVAILSLALGIGANTAIFSLLDALLLKSLPVSHPEQLQSVTIEKDSTSFTNPLWESIRDRQDVYSSAAAFGGWRFNLAHGGEARYAESNFVSGRYFEMLGVMPALGRTFNDSDDKRGCAGTAVLGYGFWQKEYGGRADVIGKSISLDMYPFEIIGVAASGFSGVVIGRGIDVFVPICSEKIIRGETSALDRRSNWWLQIMGRPKPGVSVQQAAARLETIAPQVMEDTLPLDWDAVFKTGYLKRPLGAIPAGAGVSYLRKQYQPALITLMIAVGLVLLIACANVANLLLARGAARQREIAIRMALGSGRGRLIRQLLTESLLLSILGAALGILFAQWGSRLLLTFLSSRSNRVFLDLTIDLRMLAFTAAVAIMTGILFGIAPAWKGTRVDPQAAMKANARGVIEGSKFGIGKALVMVQIALSLLLVVGAGLMLSTFWKLSTLDPGFDRGHVLLLSVDLRSGNYPKEQRNQVYDQMLQKLRAIPGVASASSSDLTPVSGSSWNQNVVFPGYTPKSKYDNVVWFNRVSPRFFETLGTPILAGRDFNDHDTAAAPKVAIINQTAAKKFFGNENPIGRTYQPAYGKDRSAIEIIGIVGDAKYRNLNEDILPSGYVPMEQDAAAQQTNFELRATPGYNVTSLIPAAKSTIQGINSNVSLEFTTLAIQLDESLTRERLLATLSGFFGGLALLLATIGLYGVMSYNVARRRNEIGIRMALGAEQSRVLRMVLREVMLLIAIGLIVGLGVAMATTRFVATFLYGMKPNDPSTLVLSAAILVAVALVAGYLPARRAARLDPMSALREE